VSVHGLVWRCDELATRSGCTLLLANDSWNRLKPHRGPELDSAGTENGWVDVCHWICFGFLSLYLFCSVLSYSSVIVVVLSRLLSLFKCRAAPCGSKGNYI